MDVKILMAVGGLFSAQKPRKGYISAGNQIFFRSKYRAPSGFRDFNGRLFLFPDFQDGPYG